MCTNVALTLLEKLDSDSFGIVLVQSETDVHGKDEVTQILEQNFKIEHAKQFHVPMK